MRRATLPNVHTFITAFSSALLLSMHAALALTLPRDKIGIADNSGKVIVPCEFFDAKYLGRGLFFLTEFQSSNPTVPSHCGRLYDHEGKRISISLPPHCTIDRVILPEDFAGKGGIAYTLPQDAVVEICGPQGFGLCRASGAVLLEPNYVSIVSLGKGYFAVNNKNSHHQDCLSFVFNSKTAARVKAPPNSTIGYERDCDIISFSQSQESAIDSSGYMSIDGTVLIPARFEHVRSFSTDGLASVMLHERKGNFYIDRKGRMVSPAFSVAGDFKNGLAVAGLQKQPSTCVGLIDTRFRFVLPANYYNITPLFPGIYSARTTAGGQFIAINPAGKMLFKFPPQVSYIIGVKNDRILCTGSVRGSKNSSEYEIGRTGKVLSVNLCGPAEGNAAVLEKASPDRVFKRVQKDKFYPESFKHSYPRRRISQFGDFLHCYNVIGMPRSQVRDLLGDDGDIYDLLSTAAVTSKPFDSILVQFEYTDEKVSGWRTKCNPWPGWCDTDVVSPWVRKNMEFDWPNYGVLRPTPFPFKLRAKEQKASMPGSAMPIGARP